MHAGRIRRAPRIRVLVAVMAKTLAHAWRRSVLVSGRGRRRRRGRRGVIVAACRGSSSAPWGSTG